jgi:hypothetical protein
VWLHFGRRRRANDADDDPDGSDIRGALIKRRP